jgi:hypothetical protein
MDEYPLIILQSIYYFRTIAGMNYFSTFDTIKIVYIAIQINN